MRMTKNNILYIFLKHTLSNVGEFLVTAVTSAILFVLTYRYELWVPWVTEMLSSFWYSRRDGRTWRTCGLLRWRILSFDLVTPLSEGETVIDAVLVSTHLTSLFHPAMKTKVLRDGEGGRGDELKSWTSLIWHVAFSVPIRPYSWLIRFFEYC